MIEEQLITTIMAALKTDGFVGVAKQKSSRSVTVSAHKGERRAVVHVTDPDPVAGPRSGVNPTAPQIEVTARRAFVPTPVRASGSSTDRPVPVAANGTSAH